MPYTYAVLGAGRQGTAAAYDMARWGDARRVILADYDLEVARQAAERVNKLLGRTVAEPVQVDVTDLEAVERVLSEVDAFLSAVPYFYNLGITKVAIRVGAHMCDLGGHTGIARQQHGFDSEARAAGISIIPNCGQVPGMGTTLMVYSTELLDEAVDVYMWDGGLPPEPKTAVQLPAHVQRCRADQRIRRASYLYPELEGHRGGYDDGTGDGRVPGTHRHLGGLCRWRWDRHHALDL